MAHPSLELAETTHCRGLPVREARDNVFWGQPGPSTETLADAAPGKTPSSIRFEGVECVYTRFRCLITSRNAAPLLQSYLQRSGSSPRYRERSNRIKAFSIQGFLDRLISRSEGLVNPLGNDTLITIRRIQVDEVDLFREIRLAALQEAPYAFSTTYESALQRSGESWREQVESTAKGSDRATFLAVSEDTPIGVAALYRLEDQADIGEVLQVWIRPEYRGTRLARDLMDTIFAWAKANSFRRIIAGVTKGNARALRFYTNYGFSVVDESSSNDSEGISLMKEVESG
jgi:GNAT superfamily N-acetyltransferase